jgi:hypothetical protein
MPLPSTNLTDRDSNQNPNLVGSRFRQRKIIVSVIRHNIRRVTATLSATASFVPSLE